MNYGSATFSLFLGNGDGTFQAKKDTNTSTMPTDAVVVDINGDKKLDVLVTHLAVNTTNVYLGNGDGTFLTPKVLTTPTTQPVAFELADLNGDAKLDAVFGSFNSGNIYVHLGNGDGTFQTGQMNAIAGVTQIAGLDLADVNADQKLDIVAVGANTNMAYVLLSSGNGAFQASKMAGAVNMQPQHIMAGDVTGDGKIDLVISNSSSNNVSLLPGVGDGTFMTKKDFAVGTTPQQVLVTDINGDGMLDAFTANTGAGSNNVNLLPGVGANGFGTAVAIATGTNSTPQGVHAVDVNGDKLLDLVTSNLGNGTVGIFLQQCK